MFTDVRMLRNALRAGGFTSLMFPGGGGDERKHHASLIAWNCIGNKIFCVVLPSRFIPPMLGDKKDESFTKDELPLDTAIREMYEETSLRVERNSVHRCFENTFPKDGVKYTKHYFTSRVPLIDLENVDNSKVKEGLSDPECGLPLVVEVSVLAEFLFDSKDRPSLYTRVALKYALEKQILYTIIPERVSEKYVHVARRLPSHEDLIRVYEASSGSR